MFKPDEELIHIAGVTSYRFHATIGLDPFGNFQEIDGLSYKVPAFEYKELGRNHSPWKLPFEGPAETGELTLKWGMVIRSKLYDWIHDVKLGKDFLKDVWIFQLSHKAIPLRIYHLSGCFPISWESGTFSASGPAELATETVTLAYDNIDMANVSALAIAGDLLDEPVAELVDKLRPRKSQASIGRDSVAVQNNVWNGTRTGRFAWEALPQKKLRKKEAGEQEGPEYFAWDPLEQRKLKERKKGKQGSLKRTKFGAKAQTPKFAKRKDGKPVDFVDAEGEPTELEILEIEDTELEQAEPPESLALFHLPGGSGRTYQGVGRATDDRLPLSKIYEAYGGVGHIDPLADAYVPLGGDGTGEVAEGEAYAAVAGDAADEGEDA